MCERHARTESQRHCSQPSDNMPGMAHHHPAMKHPGVEVMSAVLASQSCQTTCIPADRLNAWRKILPQVTVVQTGTVVLGTAKKFPVPDSAAACIFDGSPPSPHPAFSASFTVLRI